MRQRTAKAACAVSFASKKNGFTEIRTPIARFKVSCANRYTIKPLTCTRENNFYAYKHFLVFVNVFPPSPCFASVSYTHLTLPTKRIV